MVPRTGGRVGEGGAAAVDSLQMAAKTARPPQATPGCRCPTASGTCRRQPLDVRGRHDPQRHPGDDAGADELPGVRRQGTALRALMRMLGGSIGIAILEPLPRSGRRLTRGLLGDCSGVHRDKGQMAVLSKSGRLDGHSSGGQTLHVNRALIWHEVLRAADFARHRRCRWDGSIEQSRARPK